MLFKKLLKSTISQREEQKREQTYTNLIRREAKIGGTVFGPVDSGRHREFFCLDEHTWVWHEEWTDRAGEKHAVVTSYSVRPDGILKSQNHGTYQRVSPQEAFRLYRAANIYRAKIGRFYARPV